MPDITLCAVSGTLLPQTLTAIDHARDCARFADIVFVTDRPENIPQRTGMRVVGVNSLRSREDYSLVVQRGLGAHIQTPFVMLVQWDGYPARPANWTNEFLDYDYIGAPWPQFSRALAVGNGGFSLRSRRLLEACDDPLFQPGHPEDLGICHVNRTLLETVYGLRFAPAALAQRFSCERMGTRSDAFGFHGLFNMPYEMGLDAFLAFFATLDLRQIGVRELCDLRDVLLRAQTGEACMAARRLAYDLIRHAWREPALWRYVWRKLRGVPPEIPLD